jgi:predicted component of type VI protein secretion system
VSTLPAIKLLRVSLLPGVILLPLLTTPAMKQLKKKSLYCSLIASQQSMKKLPGSKFFSFIAGIVDGGD